VEFGDVVRKRHMVRNYTTESVDRDSVDRIVDAAVRAPSAGFSQGQRFVVVTDAETRKAVAYAAGESEYVEKGFDAWVSKAPVHIVLCADKQSYLDRYAESDKSGTEDWTVPYWWVDAGLSLMAILYAAVDEGLAAGFLGGHALKNLHDALDIPNDILIAGVVTIGHAAPDRETSSLERGRESKDRTIRWERW